MHVRLTKDEREATVSGLRKTGMASLCQNEDSETPTSGSRRS
jgi:hypothetical protein